MNKGSQLNEESGVSDEQGASAERLELTMTRMVGSKVETPLHFIRRTPRVAFCRQFESTKMTENKINIVVFDSSNALLDSLEISVIDHGIELLQMVEEIVKDYSVDSISILIENKLTFLNLAICNDRSCSWGNKIIK